MKRKRIERTNREKTDKEINWRNRLDCMKLVMVSRMEDFDDV